MKHLFLAAVAATSFVLPAFAAEPAPVPSPGEIAAAAPAGDWVAIAPADLLVMDLAPDAKGRQRRVIIQLMPAPFSQGWIGNIRKLAAAHWWDGTSVNRVQDNYVAQWGDATEKKALPAGLATVPEVEYVNSDPASSQTSVDGKPAIRLSKDEAARRGEQIERAGKRDIFGGMSMADAYAPDVMFADGWPIGYSDAQVPDSRWPLHCYGAVGVGRNLSPDTGSGAELYAVIGHAPRHLDRNIAVVGRVISGIEHLSSLPRGTGALGFYEDAADRVAIISIRIATDLPAADRPRFEYLSTDSDSFARYADARANRRDPFFIRPAGGADICNIPVPVRPVAAK
ncbi:MAG: peptidylprolyl isomerase [Sphingopyxis sp.]|uniref:peptidylprolyl isomerase n=1 Tax=Sphingopyxis sp. TaxID=1908224 RepID=UPI001A206432|nr:peptidylprolyl isomerase [Sphingopyxis sp.]MBJ7498582.1 peptidylprolyl isomerase [Sphingopyxis sp.]